MSSIETIGRATLYLVKRDGAHFVTDWPSVLSFKAAVRKGHHNIARYRYDVWFTGPDGAQWHGVTYGEYVAQHRRKALGLSVTDAGRMRAAEVLSMGRGKRR